MFLSAFYYFLVINCFLACTPPNRGEDEKKAVEKIEGYTINNPSQKYALHHDLDEISGLDYYKKDQIAAIEDETGKLYLYNLPENKIDIKIKFAKSGDYEGVEIIDDTAYVIRSDGKLFSFPVIEDHKSSDTKDTKLPLSIANDVEGLGLWNNKLIIACKGSGDIKGSKVKGKAIYAYDLGTKQFSKDPWVAIKNSHLKNFNESNGGSFKINDFRPSGISVHPVTKDIYILAHAGKLLVVLHPDKTIKNILKLNRKTFKQPEGICFAPDGTLYIANEAQGGRANILKFDYQP